MSQLSLEATGVSRVFSGSGGPIVALESVDLNISRNEFVCLVGPSGCGKSTFLSILAGLESPSGGSLKVNGLPLEGPGADRGMVFQSDCLFPWLSVRDNVHFGLSLIETRRLYGIKIRQLKQHCDQLLESVGLWAFRDYYPKQLSGGMRQRTAIVRALATQPDILLMDEPFGALDAQTREDMQLLLQRLCVQQGSTVLFVTHDVEEAVFLGDRVLVMGASPGRIVMEVPVPLPRPRNYQTKTHADFQKVRRQVLDQLYQLRSGSLHNQSSEGDTR